MNHAYGRVLSLTTWKDLGHNSTIVRSSFFDMNLWWSLLELVSLSQMLVARIYQRVDMLEGRLSKFSMASQNKIVTLYDNGKLDRVILAFMFITVLCIRYTTPSKSITISPRPLKTVARVNFWIGKRCKSSACSESGCHVIQTLVVSYLLHDVPHFQGWGSWTGSPPKL